MYCLSATVQGGVQLLGGGWEVRGHSEAGDGRDPDAYPPTSESGLRG